MHAAAKPLGGHSKANITRIPRLPKTHVTDSSVDVRAVWSLHSFSVQGVTYTRGSVVHNDEKGNSTTLEHTATTGRPVSVLDAYTMLWADAEANCRDIGFLELLKAQLQRLVKKAVLN